MTMEAFSWPPGDAHLPGPEQRRHHQLHQERHGDVQRPGLQAEGGVESRQPAGLDDDGEQGEGAGALLNVGDQRPVGQADAQQQPAEIGGMGKAGAVAIKAEQAWRQDAQRSGRQRRQSGDGDGNLQ